MNTQFQRLFTQLFGGGTAELQLIEAEDPLEAGARNPGQAAGQEARDAVAALGRRAGADRARADLRGVPHQSGADLRAGRGRRAARRSQRRALLLTCSTRWAVPLTPASLIITHNPITMARMNRLFGVTMAERGVSQLVSVDLEAAVRIRGLGGVTF